MNRRKTGLLFVVVSVLSLLMVSACGMLSEGLEKGYNLVLTVQGQSPGRAVTVDYHDVTRLEIEVRRTENSDILEQFFWAPGDDDDRFIVNLGATGDYVLKVTHFYEDGGVEKTAEEWAKFKIKSYIITMINIMPGAVGAIDILPPPDPIDDLQGLWYGSGVPYWDEPYSIDIYSWIGPGNRFRSTLYYPEESGLESLIAYSTMGSVEIIDGMFHPTISAVFDGDTWISPPPPDFMAFDSAFEVDGDTFTLYQDLAPMGGELYVWTMDRVEPFCDPTGNWIGSDLDSPEGSPIEADLEFNDDGTYQLIMHFGDPAEPLGFSTRGFWWVANEKLVMDAMEIFLNESNNPPGDGGWCAVSDTVPGIGWDSPYICGDGKLTLWIDFLLDGSFIGEWNLNQAP